MELPVAPLQYAGWNLGASAHGSRFCEFLQPEARDRAQWLIYRKRAAAELPFM
jgi:hypothetical protein